MVKHIILWPVSYTHLDVYKRQIYLLMDTVKLFSDNSIAELFCSLLFVISQPNRRKQGGN